MNTTIDVYKDFLNSEERKLDEMLIRYKSLGKSIPVVEQSIKEIKEKIKEM